MELIVCDVGRHVVIVCRYGLYVVALRAPADVAHVCGESAGGVRNSTDAE